MTIDREMLGAYADGELDGAARDEVETALASDPALRAELGAHRALRMKLSAHFAPIAAAPVPERLIAAVASPNGASGAVVDLAAVREARRTRLVRWSWIAAPALAASLALALFGPGRGSPEGYAKGALAQALDSQLVATQPGDAPTRILLSFRDDGGTLCRGFAGRDAAGIACRDAQGWKLKTLRPGAATATGEFRQAGSGAADVLAAAQDMAAGGALDAKAEAAARARGWR